MARMLESASLSAAHRIDLPKVNHEPSPIAVLSRDGVARPRLPAAILRNIRQSLHPAKVLVWQWMVGFKRDWNVMIARIPIAQLKKFLLQWLREPLSSKRLPSSKN